MIKEAKEEVGIDISKEQLEIICSVRNAKKL